MVNTSSRPITVDGVRLDTLAWNVTKITRQTAGRRSFDQDHPYLDGAISAPTDALEVARFGLEMWLRGTDADGQAVGQGPITKAQENLDELVHLFGKRHAFLDVREQVDEGGTVRRAWCKVADVIAPDLNLTSTVATFTVGLVIPSGMWEDVGAEDWSEVTTGGTFEVDTLRGATERANDAIFLVTGPINVPKITDAQDPTRWVSGPNLTTGQVWRFNSATWESVRGTGIDFDSTTGLTDVSSSTVVSGAPSAYGLPLTPARDTGQRRVKVTLSSTGGTSGATAIAVRATRRYAL